mmetsp:Transcript_70253/g.195541  ORF Transcript_70253/g.195541 Transcript_70253/m.195541 type:complete len:775 (+) Transcript_70253:86-2410(+)|eukprot:CAMPEP_0117516682 /NCGR_PEP_ID=MMETSP0784-20121206/31219_1 /TAXON_ID=39447 /ORGANISM="" /LENGTH=774 /DNA_ID=CAMNT_0005312533 /DNA_START=23 /DNA_END=2347 /DNA_ORIENTATION=-
MGCGASADYKLTQEQLLRVETSRGVRLYHGPQAVYLSRWNPPLKEDVQEIVKLEADEYAIIRDTSKMVLRTEAGEQRFFLQAEEELVFQGKKYCLSQTEYCYVNDGGGRQRLVKGPLNFVPSPYESVEPKQDAIILDSNMYIRVQDRVSGESRVERGPQLVFLEPSEQIYGGGPQRAVEVDAENVVLVRDTLDGSLHLVQEPGLFYPRANDEIVNVLRPADMVKLAADDYAVIRDTRLNQLRTEVGEQRFFLQVHEELVRRGQATRLSPTEYCYVEDGVGQQRLVRGPLRLVPGPDESITKKSQAITLDWNMYAKVQDKVTGEVRVERGPQLLFPEPSEHIIDGGPQKAVELDAEAEYCYVEDGAGKMRLVKGPLRFIPGPQESTTAKKQAITLDSRMYVKVLDKVTGDIRVERGPQLVFPEPSEQIVGKGPSKAVQVDSETAVLVRDLLLGDLRLVQDHGLFFPRAQDEIVDVQKLIRLADHDALVMKDETGAFKYFFGSDELRGDQPRAFFLPPYCEIVEHVWSRGRRRQTRDLRITQLDMRPQFMNFEFNSRTSDNVELILEGTFYWQLSDVPKMMIYSGDVTGDICNYARSAFIQKISQVTLKQFMDDFRRIASSVVAENMAFYVSRGLKVHSLEVTGYRCADASTAAILQQMIQETTNRMNRTSQQESENELKMNKIQGEIEQERVKGELLSIKQGHLQEEARAAGRSDAERASQFLRALEDVVPDTQERVAMWKMLRKGEALECLSGGSAHLYFTPSDVNLSIEDRGR